MKPLSGPPMTLGNMRELGVHHLIGYCHDDACRHQAIIDVSRFPDAVEVPWFQSRARCSKCGGRRRCATELGRGAGHARRLARALGLGKLMVFIESGNPP